MGTAQQFVFPGAIFGSLVLAVFAFLVTAGANLPVNMSSPSPLELNASKSVASSSTVQKNDQSDGGNIETVNPGKGTKEEKVVQGNCGLSKKYPEKILQWCDFITKYAQKTNLDADLIAALIWQESGGNPVAYSASGAVGLMQVMPSDGIAASFMCKNGPCFADRPTIGELQDPQFNIKYGTSMLAGLVAKYGNIKEALRYYGPRDVGYYYADKVLGIYQNYRK